MPRVRWVPSRAIILVLSVMIGGTSLSGSLAAPASGARRVGEEVHGRVIQITTNQIYVDIGRRLGLRKGDTISVQLPDRTWLELQVDGVGPGSASAVLPSGERLPAAGARVRARWRQPEPPLSGLRPALPAPPEPAEIVVARWEGVPRRREQLIDYRAVAPRPGLRGDGGVHGSLRIDYLGLLNAGAEEPRDYHRIGLASTLEVPRLFVDWLDYMHDIQVRLHLARDLDVRPFPRSRPFLLVNQLRFGLTLPRVRAELGRTVGGPLPGTTTIDGSAVQVRLTKWLFAGGFGGTLPRPDDLRPSLEGSQFGAFASVRLESDPHASRDWFFAADAGFLGSTWDGAMDRRLVSGSATLEWARVSLDTQVAVDLFAADHPSGLSAAELSLLSAEVEGRVLSWLRLGGRFDRYRLVPTRESLATFPEVFVGEGPVSSGRGFADLQLGNRVAVSAQGGLDRQSPDSWAGWGEVMLRVHPPWAEGDLLRLAALTSHGSVLIGYGGQVAYLWSPVEWLAFNLSYGLHRDRYAQYDAVYWRHDLGLGGEATLGRHWLLVSEVRLLASGEERLVQLLGSVGYRL